MLKCESPAGRGRCQGATVSSSLMMPEGVSWV
ncbi:hypothetical protein ACTIVE_7349 [Actinomadura verrucosospora]|uniref:Uncharacterized protein n=1 Tax=Actinomadura verrucosospora TaxID=46165 RepID=A0A7D3ZJT9_ACTVE|nr:hypothetical protein ACTIVE_7349 [Actinomadura verrucosospora]